MALFNKVTSSEIEECTFTDTASKILIEFSWFKYYPANHNLRNSSTDLALPKPKRDFLKKRFKYSSAILWNSLAIEAKLATSENLFKINFDYNM